MRRSVERAERRLILWRPILGVLVLTSCVATACLPEPSQGVTDIVAFPPNATVIVFNRTHSAIWLVGLLIRPCSRAELSKEQVYRGLEPSALPPAPAGVVDWTDVAITGPGGALPTFMVATPGGPTFTWGSREQPELPACEGVAAPLGP